MQPTEKYYEHDAYRREAVGHILAAEPDSRTGGGRIALDGTVFYPEGGGQPADRGTLTLADGTVLTVTDVHEQAGVIWHTVSSLPAGAVPGAEAAQAIDWAWRFDKMQQHTGEHILSGILHSMFGAENVGFHIGAEAVRMDTSVPISAEGLRAAELEANRIVWQDVPVVITYPTPQELAALTYRSKKELEGQVRIVTIPGADVCACCGTHTRTTGQVGQIKILTSENYKGGVRLSIVCGARALEAAQAMRARQADIGALLSAKANQTAVAVHRVYDEYTALKFNHFGLCSQLFDVLAAAVEPGQGKRSRRAASRSGGGRRPMNAKALNWPLPTEISICSLNTCASRAEAHAAWRSRRAASSQLRSNTFRQSVFCAQSMRASGDRPVCASHHASGTQRPIW